MQCAEKESFPQKKKLIVEGKFIPKKFFHIPQPPVDKLQAGIDVGGDVPNVVLQFGVATLYGAFHLTNGVDNGGVVLVQLLADVRGGEVGHLPNQVNGYLTGFCRTLVFQCTAKHILFHGVELTNLRNNQAGSGQGVALALEHIVNGPGNIGQVQHHTV